MTSKSNALAFFSGLITLSAFTPACVFAANFGMNTRPPWYSALEAKSVKTFHACGNANIQANNKSLHRDFLFGIPKRGIVLTDLLAQDVYSAILQNENLLRARERLQIELSKAHLWVYTEAKVFEDIGLPSKIEVPFTATVKDCMEGAKTTLGMDCSKSPIHSRQWCCREKFVDPVIYWGTPEKSYRLYYGSRQLKIPGEKVHRYCTGKAIQL